MPDDFQERTEAPTDKKRSDSRSKGTVAKSTEVNTVLVLLGSYTVLKIWGSWMFEKMSDVITFFFGLISDPPRSLGAYVDLFGHAMKTTGMVVGPIMATLLLIGLVANYFQVGLLFTLKPLMPKLSKINPISGFGRLFSVKSLVETAKSIMKIVIIAFIAYQVISGDFERMLQLTDMPVGAIWTYVTELSSRLILRIALLLIVLAILDYAYQRYDYEKNLKMTKEEVKEERKQMEGDPQMKGRIRTVQREMLRRRMMQEVPQATVVVTNPTYIAIAIRYEATEMDTPKVLAKGKRLIAERIKTMAKENGIPIVEDKPLARAMYEQVEPGDDIPMEFFSAVAEILAYVYRLKNRNAA